MSRQKALCSQGLTEMPTRKKDTPNLLASERSFSLFVCEADLRGAFLIRATLIATDFSRANLSGANLSGADLYGAHLRETTLEGLLYDLATKWPVGFDPKEQGEKLILEEFSGSSGRQLSNFSISFYPQLSSKQIRSALEALADYFRACGGAGLKIEFELQIAEIGVMEYVGR
jgi:hypothetical protein